eukprot:2813456-Pleurochrysis_carterae.AAC.1
MLEERERKRATKEPEVTYVTKSRGGRSGGGGGGGSAQQGAKQKAKGKADKDTNMEGAAVSNFSYYLSKNYTEDGYDVVFEAAYTEYLTMGSLKELKAKGWLIAFYFQLEEDGG